MDTIVKRPGLVLLLCLVVASCGQDDDGRSIEWSPDGERVAFDHPRTGAHSAHRSGEDLIRMVGEEGEQGIAPSWSPQGDRLLFATLRKDGSGYRAWIQSAGSGEATAILTASCACQDDLRSGETLGWHPDGRRILYVDAVEEGGYSLFERDLESGRSRRILQAAGTRLRHRASPDGAYLGCVLVRPRPGTYDRVEVLLAPADPAGDWWRVPGTGVDPGATDLSSRLPVWSPDGSRFALAAIQASPLFGGHLRPFVLLEGSIEERSVRTWYRGRGPLGGLRWSPDGRRLGFLDGATLLAGEAGVGLEPDPVGEDVVDFAGWDAGGCHLAYVRRPRRPDPPRSLPLLLTLLDRTRDELHVASASGEGGRLVLSAPRIARPCWSPRREELALFVEFHSTRRNLDPAAVYDVATGELRSMPTDDTDRLAIAHLHLSWGEPDLALATYDELDRHDEDLWLYRHLALRRVGRFEEASALLEGRGGESVPERIELALAMAGHFLDLDAAGEGERFFLEQDDLASDLALAWLALAGHRFEPYADHVAGRLLPRLLATWHPQPIDPADPGRWSVDDGALLGAAGLVLLPMWDPRFVATLPPPVASALARRLDDLSARAEGDVRRLLVDLLRVATHEALDDAPARDRIATSIQANPARAILLPAGGVPEFLAGLTR